MTVNILKYFITTITAISLVCSCKTITIDAPMTETLPAIEFSNVSTKAALNDIQTNGFGVWALLDNATVTDELILNNAEVTYNSAEGWIYEPLRYWVNDSDFTFLAAYPYDEKSNYPNDEGIYTLDPGNSSLNLTLSETPSTVDYMMATNMTDTSVEGFSETVDLQFKHLLTSVSLNIWRDDVNHNSDQMRITHVTLGNIRESGTYSSNEDKWSPTNEKITLERIYENLTDSDNIGSARVNTDGTLTPGVYNPAKPFTDQLLIPQTLDASNKVSLKIYYQLWRDTGDDTDPNATKNWEDAELEAYLPYGTWEPNKRYMYNVVLSSVKDITFYYIQTKISPWGAPQVGGTIIIK